MLCFERICNIYLDIVPEVPSRFCTPEPSFKNSEDQTDLAHSNTPNTRSFGIEIIRYYDKFKSCTGLTFCLCICLLGFLAPDANKLIELLEHVKDK